MYVVWVNCRFNPTVQSIRRLRLFRVVSGVVIVALVAAVTVVVQRRGWSSTLQTKDHKNDIPLVNSEFYNTLPGM